MMIDELEQYLNDQGWPVLRLNDPTFVVDGQTVKVAPLYTVGLGDKDWKQCVLHTFETRYAKDEHTIMLYAVERITISDDQGEGKGLGLRPHDRIRMQCIVVKSI